MSKSLKSQVSIEFIALVSFLLLLLILSVYSSSSQLFHQIFIRRYNKAEILCKYLQDEINLALKAGDGYRRSFFLPLSLEGSNYEIILDNYTLYIKWGNYQTSCFVPIESINGKIKKGWNKIKVLKNEIYIE